MLYDDQDKVFYLANVLKVVFLDGKISSNEQEVIEEIRKSIDAKKNIISQAQKVAESGTYSFIKIGSFSDQVKNLEDMLLVATSDNDISSEETNYIYEFCHLIGLYKDQLDKMIEDATKKWAVSDSGKTCPKCNATSNPSSKYCSSCGHPLADDSDSVKISFQIPNKGYAIEFCESTSANFPKILDLATATNSIQTAIKNKKTWYLVSYDSENIEEIIPIASLLSSIRNKRLYFDGEEKIWDEVFGFTWCACRRQQAYRPMEYCFGKDENRLNPWGCRQSRMDWINWAPWFSYGKWEKPVGNKTYFSFDKTRIRHELESNLYQYRFCPYLNTNFAIAVLKYLPNTVEATKNGPWKYNQLYQPLPGTIKIIERNDEGGFSFSTEYYSDGVRPNGFKVLNEILTQALKECGLSPDKLKFMMGC